MEILSASNPSGAIVQIATRDHQNVPYERNAVPANVLPCFISKIPAIICAKPPNANPIAIITMDRGIRSALCRFNKIVVMPNPSNPRGPGFANFLTSKDIDFLLN